MRSGALREANWPMRSAKVFNANHTKQCGFTDRTDQAQTGGLDVAIHWHFSNDLETEAQFRVNPAFEHGTGATRTNEASPLHLLFKFGLTGGADIKVAGSDSAE